MACPDDVTKMAEMSEKISQLNMMLRRPIWLDPTSGSLRVIFNATQNVAVTSGTITTLTQKAGIDLGVTEIRYEMKDRWQHAVRRNIT